MDIIPAGHYRAVVSPILTSEGNAPVQFCLSSKRTEQVLINFQLLDEPYSGITVPWWGSFSDKAAPFAIKALRVCGFTGDDLSSIVTQSLENEVSLEIKHETDEKGVTRSKVAWVNSPGGHGLVRSQSPMTKDALRLFAAKMKSFVATVPPVAPMPTKAGNGAAPQPAANPFAA